MSQNLFINGDFEEMSSYWDSIGRPNEICINTERFINRRYSRNIFSIAPIPGLFDPNEEWKRPSFTYNCSRPQYPKPIHGNGMVSTFHLQRNNLFGGCLMMKSNYPLTKGFTYNITFFASIGDTFISHPEYYPSHRHDALGFAPTTYRQVDYVFDSMMIFHNASKMNYTFNTAGWQKISYDFYADSAYSFFVIGNLFKNYPSFYKHYYNKEIYQFDTSSLAIETFFDSMVLRPKGSISPKIKGPDRICKTRNPLYRNVYQEPVMWQIGKVLLSIDSVLSFSTDTPVVLIAYNSAGSDTMYIQVGDTLIPPQILASDFFCDTHINLTFSGGQFSSFYWNNPSNNDSNYILNQPQNIVFYYSNGVCTDSVNFKVDRECPPLLPDTFWLCRGKLNTLKTQNQISASWYINQTFYGSGISISVPSFSGKVVAKNNLGEDSAVLISVDCPDSFQLYIPNAFSPNQNGINEYFKPVCYGCDLLQWEVWSMWGELLYKGSDSDMGWDGQYQGKNAPADAYIFKVYAEHSYLGSKMVSRENGVLYLIR